MSIIEDRWIAEFFTVAVLHALAVISPGPDFAVVIKQTINHGSTIGKITAIGVGTAILTHIAYSLLGIGLVLKSSPMLFNVLKLSAAAYLFYLGFTALRTKRKGFESSESPNPEANTTQSTWQAFRIGFLTNGLNPKATLFFFSLFAVIIDPSTPERVQVFYGLYMALATSIWFIIVAMIFGQARVRQQFERMGHWFDRVMGIALIAIGIKIVFSELN